MVANENLCVGHLNGSCDSSHPSLLTFFHCYELCHMDILVANLLITYSGVGGIIVREFPGSQKMPIFKTFWHIWLLLFQRLQQSTLPPTMFEPLSWPWSQKFLWPGCIQLFSEHLSQIIHWGWVCLKDCGQLIHMDCWCFQNAPSSREKRREAVPPRTVQTYVHSGPFYGTIEKWAGLWCMLMGRKNKTRFMYWEWKKYWILKRCKSPK